MLLSILISRRPLTLSENVTISDCGISCAFRWILNINLVTDLLSRSNKAVLTNDFGVYQERPEWIFQILESERVRRKGVWDVITRRTKTHESSKQRSHHCPENWTVWGSRSRRRKVGVLTRVTVPQSRLYRSIIMAAKIDEIYLAESHDNEPCSRPRPRLNTYVDSWLWACEPMSVYLTLRVLEATLILIICCNLTPWRYGDYKIWECQIPGIRLRCVQKLILSRQEWHGDNQVSRQNHTQHDALRESCLIRIGEDTSILSSEHVSHNKIICLWALSYELLTTLKGFQDLTPLLSGIRTALIERLVPWVRRRDPGQRTIPLSMGSFRYNMRQYWWKLWCFLSHISNSQEIKTNLQRAACSNADYDVWRKIRLTEVEFRTTSRGLGWENIFWGKGCASHHPMILTYAYQFSSSVRWLNDHGLMNKWLFLW